MTTNNLDDTYAFAARHSDGRQFIKILDGPLAGAVVDIKKVTIPTRPDNGENFTLSIKYDFIENPVEHPVDDSIINQVLGEIAVDIILYHKVKF